MGALWAALSCSLMVVVAVAAIAWFALTGRNRSTTPAASRGSDQVAALRAEIAELRREQSSEQLGQRV